MESEIASGDIPEETQYGLTVQLTSRHIRLPEVMKRVGISRSAIYERMAEGDFPRS